MKRFRYLPDSLQERFQEHSLLKVISGLDNFDKDSVIRVAKAAGNGSADLLDVAADPELIHLAIKHSDLPVCVSAVDPSLFIESVRAGASIIEIGNFDSFYPKGRFFSAIEVLALAKETRQLLPDVVLSVTVPHHLPLDQQAHLALDLFHLDCDIIQTEGGTSSNPSHSGDLGLIEKAAPALAATHSIAQAFANEEIVLPILTASGISAVTAPLAIAAGGHGVGVGSCVNRLDDLVAMVAEVRRLRESLTSFSRHLSGNSF